MPQMMPLKWLMYYFLFIIMILMMMSMIHYIKNYKQHNKKINLNKKNWYWK